VKNCDSLTSKDDRKLCLRQKRRQCKRQLAKRHPDWTAEEVVAKCKRIRKRFDRCVRKLRKEDNVTKKSARKICRKKNKKSATKF
jgi:hypothetical protein